MTSESTSSDYSPNRGESFPEISIVADSEVLESQHELVVAACEGIEDVLGLMGDAGRYNTNLLGQASSLTDIEGSVSNSQGQVQIEPLLEAIAQIGFATPERPVFGLISKDLVAQGTNFIFGVTKKELGVSLQSIARFIAGISEPGMQAIVIKHIARHEFGHLVGLDGSTIRKQDTRGGIREGHCANECTMQQVMSVQETAEVASKLMAKPHAGFCADCAAFLTEQSHR